MARLVTICDRAPSDTDWKGAIVWKTILGLAESQHEVLALTPLDPSEVEIAHPRLTIVRPAESFSFLMLGRWLRAVFQFQPEIIQTFALRMPGRLSSWPVLAQTLLAFPGVQRYSTVFAEEDYAPFARISAPFDAAEFSLGGETSPANSNNSYVVIPAPVSEWQKPIVDILMLGDYLEQNPGVDACVVGGWGEAGLLDRREGWGLLGPLSARVRMLPSMQFPDFVNLARASRGLWLRSLRANSWRGFVSSHVAQVLQLPTIGATPLLNAGSTANFLSRLYSN